MVKEEIGREGIRRKRKTRGKEKRRDIIGREKRRDTKSKKY